MKRNTAIRPLRRNKSCCAAVIKILLRTGAVVLIAAVAFATLGPPRSRRPPSLGQDGKHALAFVLVGLAVGLAFPQRKVPVAAVSVVLIRSLEIKQLQARGRHTRLAGLVVDAVTACVGLVGAALIGRVAAHWRGAASR